MLRAPLRAPWTTAAAALLVLLLAACGPDDVLDGTWRQPAGGPGRGEESWELVLGQYAGQVAGLVREYTPLGRDGAVWELYGSERFCRPLERGRFQGDVLSLELKGPQGKVRRFSLALVEEDELRGETWVEGEDSQAISFQRTASEVNRECEWISELALSGVTRLDLGPEARPRVAVLYQGFGTSDACLSAGAVSAPLDRAGDEALFFSLLIGRKPPACFLVQQPDGLTLAWGVFVAFDDADGDGRWDRDPLPGGQWEELLGVAREHALLYVDGDTAQAALDPPEVLADFSAQSYSLVRVVQMDVGDERGTVRRIARVEDAQLQHTPVLIEALGDDPAPIPRLSPRTEP